MSYKRVDYVVDNAESHADRSERQRIKEERVKMIAAGCIFIVFVLATCSLGIGIKQFNSLSAYNGRGVIVFTLSEAVAALMREGIYSARYANGWQGDPDELVDRWEAGAMEGYQLNTRQALIRVIDTHQDKCKGCPSILSAIGYADIVNMQNAIMRRSVSPMEAFDFYAAATLRVVDTLNFYVGYGVGRDVAGMMWFEDVLVTTRALSVISLMWQNRGSVPSLTTFRTTATSVVSISSTSTTASAMMWYDPDIRDNFINAIEVPVRLAGALLSEVRYLPTVLESTPPDVVEFVDKFLSNYERFLGVLGETNDWDTTSYVEWAAIIILSGALMVVCAVLVVLLVCDAMSIVRAAGRELHKRHAVNRIENSLSRINRFMDRIYEMDKEGVRELARQTAECTSSTSLERDFMKLEGTVCQVLAFVHPHILKRRREVLEGAADGFCAGPLMSANETGVLGAIVPGLRLQALSLLVVDLSGFFYEVTPETFKVLPKEFTGFISEVTLLAKRCGGSLQQLAGTTLTVSWSEETSSSPENAAGLMLLHMRGLLKTYRHICCAVVSGVCLQGVVGPPSHLAHVSVGSIVRQGRLLLQIARMHGSNFVTDNSTFMKLDTQRFRKRALEKVALVRRPGTQPEGDGTVVFELSIANDGTPASEGALLWNEAFDSFHTGFKADGIRKLQLWQRQYGKTDSLKRIKSLLSESTGPRPVTYLFTDGPCFDSRLVLWNPPRAKGA